MFSHQLMKATLYAICGFYTRKLSGPMVGFVVVLTKRKTLTCNWSSWSSECWARAVRFATVASAVEAMVWESETDGNPSVDADESNR